MESPILGSGIRVFLCAVWFNVELELNNLTADATLVFSMQVL